MRRVLVPRDIAPRPPPLGVVHALAGRTMGTTWSVRLVGARQMDLQALEAGIRRELDLVVGQMSHWEPGSDLVRFNQAPAGAWQALPAPFMDVLQYALSVAADSDGAYDPTAGALVDLWGFGAQGRHDEPGFQPPGDPAVAAARSRCGWQCLQLDAAGCRARQPGGLRLDLSAVAKGYAVDRVARHLDARGFHDHLVEVGGELRGTGLKPDGQPWWVQLEPVEGHASETVVALHGLCVATSGDYRRCFHHAGVRHAHTLDPCSGRPVTHGAARVTVLHRDCMAADALSTALTVLGPDAGLDWATQRGLAALFVTRRADGGFDERMTPACEALAQ
jgi:thiamine biosynthesis lipoprotein